MIAVSLTVLAGGVWRPEGAGAVPPNDNLASAIAISTPTTSGIVAVGDNVGASLEGSETTSTCNPASTGATLWYAWTSPAGTGTVAFDTWGSDFDTTLAVYTGSAFPLTEVACNDDFLSLRSGLQFSYAASTTYRIQLGGFGGASGNVVLNMSTGAAIYVNSTGDNNVSDTALTLREAMLLAAGGTGASGLNRALSGSEATSVLNAGAAGALGSDLVHFAPSNFPPNSPQIIAIGSFLPQMNTNGDVVSGIGAGVIVDAQGLNLGTSCFWVTGNSNHIEGMQIRRCAGGYAAIGIYGTDNVAGGSLIPAQGNVLRENSVGLWMNGAAASNNLVVGNLIGTDAAGTGAMGNSSVGVSFENGAHDNTVGGSAPGEGNVISANGLGVNGMGVRLNSASYSNTVIGNKIGTDVTGAIALGNAIGVVAQSGSYGNSIGGTAPGQGNIIAYNNEAIRVTGPTSTGNAIRGNSIHSNTLTAIDNMSGGNLELPTPIIGSVAGGTVSGFACSLCAVDIYNDLAGQGRVYLGSSNADAAGNFSISGVAHTLANLTATATDAVGNTSEFSSPFAAPPNSDGDGLSDAADGCPFDPEDVDGFQDGDGCPDPDNDLDGICDPGMTAPSCTGSDSGQMVFDPAGTLPAPVLDCRNVPEDFDAFHDSDGCPEPDNDNDGFPDTTDACPGTDSLTGPDTMLGSPQDLNHNGVSDGAESPLSTDDTVLVFEDYDGVIDVDGCHDSPGDDFDGDTYTDDIEALFLGTNPMNGCPLTPTANDEDPDPWPADFDDNQTVNILDILYLTPPVFNTSPPDPNYSQRRDLNADGAINILDILLLTPPIFNTSCVP